MQNKKETLTKYAQQLNMNEEEKQDLTEIILKQDVTWDSMTEHQADRMIAAFTGFHTLQNILRNN